MEKTSVRPTTMGVVATLVLAAVAMLFLAAADLVWRYTDSAESAAVLLTIAGWAALVWAVIVGGVTVVAIIRSGIARQAVTAWELAVLAAGIAVIIVTVSLYPLWGSGSTG